MITGTRAEILEHFVTNEGINKAGTNKYPREMHTTLADQLMSATNQKSMVFWLNSPDVVGVIKVERADVFITDF